MGCTRFCKALYGPWVMGRMLLKGMAGEEFNSQLEWLSDELLEKDPAGASGSDKGVSPSSPGEYFTLTRISNGWPVNIEFVCLARGGFVPDVGCYFRDVGSGLIGPGVQEEEQSDHLEGCRSGKDCHS